ncbi:MAG TPA: hypothetical protein VMW43_01785 [Bacteroidota bacterium]|nr:hypothetical protein [Bacteroidota bacterium]
MNPQIILNIVGGITAGLVLVLGIIILFGQLLPDYIPDNYRLILGIVMVVYGTYRFIMMFMKERARKRFESHL